MASYGIEDIAAAFEEDGTGSIPDSEDDSGHNYGTETSEPHRDIALS